MKKERNVIENLLIGLVKKYRESEQLYGKAMQAFTNKIPASKVVGFFANSDYVEFKESELYLLADFLYRNLKDVERDIHKINPDDLFTEQEMFQAENTYIDEANNKKISELLLPNVKQIGENEYLCYYCPLQTISMCIDKGLTLYNFETQREPRVKKSFGQILYKPSVNKNSVDEIAEELIKETFVPNMLTWNILNTGEEQFSYDADKEELYFKSAKNSKIDMVDGYHRTLAIRKALSQNPDLKGHFIIHIFNYSVRDAQRLIVQESKGNKISHRKIKSLEVNKYQKIAKDIDSFENEEVNSLFRKIAGNIGEVYKYHTKFIVMADFADTLEYLFDDVLKTPRDNNKLVRYLVDFYNEVIGINYEHFQDIEESQKKSYITNSNTLCGFLVIARKLYDKKNWRNTLEEFFKETDFSKQNLELKEAMLESRRYSKSIMNKIIQQFDFYYEEAIK